MLVAGILVAAVAACGGPAPAPTGGTPGATGSPPDAPGVSPTAASNEACALVPAADLEDLLGEAPAAQPLSSGEFGVIAGAAYAECLWKTGSGHQVIVRSVRATAPGDLHANVDAIWQAFTEYEPVTGVGDEARVHLEGEQAAYVVAVRGTDGVYANYQSPSGDAEAKRDALITLVADTLASMAS